MRMRRQPKGSRVGGQFAPENRGRTAPTSVPTPPLGEAASAPRADRMDASTWTRHKAVWPNRETSARLIAQVEHAPEEEQLVRRAFFALYNQAWLEQFRTWDETTPVINYRTPSSSAEGWQWRKQAIERSEKAWEGARFVEASDVQVGDVIHYGFGINKVHSTSRLAVDGGPIRISTSYGWHSDVMNPGRKVLLLPAMRELENADRLTR